MPLARVIPDSAEHEAEWKARVDLAAFYRLVARYGMTDLIYNHITVRVPGTAPILIKSYGQM